LAWYTVFDILFPMKHNMSKMIGKRYGKLLVTGFVNTQRVICRCDCGKEIEAWRTNLIQGKKAHCGCEKYKDRDETGKKYGRWIVVGRHSGSVEHWECRCDCGGKGVVARSNLISGNSQSCGCLQKEKVASSGRDNWIDLTGQRFGRLIALEPVLDNGGYRRKWRCRCDCGKVKIITTSSLRNPQKGTKSCGCLIQETSRKNLIDIAGQRFGRLDVLRTVRDTNGNMNGWLCRCDCGKEKVIRAACLREGITNSCGCLQKELAGKRARERNLVDISGQRFGRLIAIKPVEGKRGHLNKWLCRCDCGKEKAITTMSLKRGATRSCGCLAREVARARRIGNNFGNSTKHSRDRRLDSNNTYWTDRVLDRDG
jgi:hypothetical protein